MAEAKGCLPAPWLGRFLPWGRAPARIPEEPREGVFVSHRSTQDPLVEELRKLLHDAGFVVYHDGEAFDPSRPLRDEIMRCLDASSHVIVLVSVDAAKSAWVAREVEYAGRKGAVIVPLFLGEAGAAELRRVLGEPEHLPADTRLEDYSSEGLGIRVPGDPPRLEDVVNEIVARLRGEKTRAPAAPVPAREATPFADLVLSLSDPHTTDDGQARATARLTYFAPGEATPTMEGEPFDYEAPLSAVEADDLRFYLERYLITPFGAFHERKEEIEGRLPRWGLRLYLALQPDDPAHRPLFEAWHDTAQQADRRLTIAAPPRPRDPEADNPQAHPAVTAILGLPWELVHDGQSWLFGDGLGARVRRALPGVHSPTSTPPAQLKPPLRVLIVCARPEDDRSRYLDHRASVRPLVEALNGLGSRAEYHFLAPPTLENLTRTIEAAQTDGRPCHVVHFDGHGVYDRRGRLGMLAFEAAGERAAYGRKTELVSAAQLGEGLRNMGIRLFFLEACQTAQADEAAEASVAGGLLQSGIPAVVAMSHSVLVETSRQFVTVFYDRLVSADRVGTAMLAGQRALARDKQRGHRYVPPAEPGGPVRREALRLDDWFVPVLYQHRDDAPVLGEPASKDLAENYEELRRLRRAGIPDAPSHSFVGRSRELLAAERLLLEQGRSWVLLQGEGGEGKTTLAAELARWWVDSGRIDKAVFASVEQIVDARSVWWAWGTQLLPNTFEREAGDDADAALERLVRGLQDRPTLLVLDNLESVLPVPEGSEAAGVRVFDDELQRTLFDGCRRLLEAAPQTRLVLTSREVPPADSGFADGAQILPIGQLGREEGIELVARVLAERQALGADPDQVRLEREEQIGRLVDLVNGHARALVLLTPELAERGLTATTEDLAELMAGMQAREGDDRERSLFASVELGLRRLDPEVRARLAPLGVFRGGGFIWAIAHVLGLDYAKDEEVPLVRGLVTTGLAQLQQPGPVLRFDPALAPRLLQELRADPAAEAAARARWVEAYAGLTDFLYQQFGKDLQLALRLTVRELPNLLAALRALAADPTADPGALVDFATRLEALVASVHRPAALREVQALREAVAEVVGVADWSNAAFQAAYAQVEALLASGRLREAIDAARALLDRHRQADPEAYPGWDGDLALARFTLGRGLKQAGAGAEALDVLTEAQRGFEVLAADGDATADRMASVCLTDSADVLRAAGQLDEAAARYEQAIARAEAAGDRRDVAVGKAQLGTVRLQQRDFPAALALHHEAKDFLEAAGEPAGVAQVWHQIGRVHQDAGDRDAAESAYLQSLRLKAERGDRAGEASTNGQLGTLYDDWPGRRAEAVGFHRRAAEAYAALEDRANEGRARSNLANTLVALGRLDEARLELDRAFVCKAGLGPSAEPWKTWFILAKLETATGRPDAATDAHHRAIAAYADARRAGWQITQGEGPRLRAAVAQALANGPDAVTDARTQLEALVARPDLPPDRRALARQAIAVLDGARDASVWQGPDLFYADAAELLLLLERLGPS